MTRFTHLFTALTLAGLLSGATVAACGVHPGSPSEIPPLAPRPDPIDPSVRPMRRTANPVPGTSAPLSPGPVTASVIPVPQIQPFAGSTADAGSTTGSGGAADSGSGGAADAGNPDASTVRLPPLPDGSVPSDSRMEPILRRD